MTACLLRLRARAGEHDACTTPGLGMEDGAKRKRGDQSTPCHDKKTRLLGVIIRRNILHPWNLTDSTNWAGLDRAGLDWTGLDLLDWGGLEWTGLDFGLEWTRLGWTGLSGFVPFPGDAIHLGPDFLWYGSPSLMGEWVGNLDAAEKERGRGKTGRQATDGDKPGWWPW